VNGTLKFSKLQFTARGYTFKVRAKFANSTLEDAATYSFVVENRGI
jgi:hypothetical protein